MIRKQLYIDEDLDRGLRRIARLSGRSEADHVREALRGYLADHVPTGEGDPWLDLVGLVEDDDGPTDVASEHDHYLYGAPKHGG